MPGLRAAGATRAPQQQRQHCALRDDGNTAGLSPTVACAVNASHLEMFSGVLLAGTRLQRRDLVEPARSGVVIWCDLASRRDRLGGMG
jgi:hypothetical protein